MKKAFIDLEEGERIIKEIHRHWFVILKSAVGLAVAACIPLAFAVMTGLVRGLSPDLVREAAPESIFLYSVWLLLLWIFFFVEWTDYYLDLWYVTDRRIIDVNQRGFFSREVISFRYDNMQNITLNTAGFIRTMLKFGDVHVQTAGTNERMIIRDCANALKVKNLIVELQEEAHKAPQRVTIVSESGSPRLST